MLIPVTVASREWCCSLQRAPHAVASAKHKMVPLNSVTGLMRRTLQRAVQPQIRWLRQARPTRRSASTRPLTLASAAVCGVLLTSTLLLAPARSDDDDQRSSDEQPSSALPTSDSHPRPSSRPFTSSPLFPHPSRPHISIATADSLPLLVDQRGERGQSVLVEVYSPYCHACERLAPILDQVAYILQHLPSSQSDTATPTSSPFLVAIMDDSRNHRPNFLTPDEERYLPVLKFFPAPTSATATSPAGITYRGPHNALSILTFINSNLPPAQQFTDTPHFQRLLTSTSPATLATLTATFRRQRDEQLKNDPTVLLFDHSPCGPAMAAMMEEMILRSYREGVEGEEGERRRRQVVERFQQCVREKRKETDKYWKSILDIAKQQLKDDEDDAEDDTAEGGEKAEQTV